MTCSRGTPAGKSHPEWDGGGRSSDDGRNLLSIEAVRAHSASIRSAVFLVQPGVSDRVDHCNDLAMRLVKDLPDDRNHVRLSTTDLFDHDVRFRAHADGLRVPEFVSFRVTGHSSETSQLVKTSVRGIAHGAIGESLGEDPRLCCSSTNAVQNAGQVV